CQQYNSYPP
nr:immunoglobulin light chain junction region [Homo sapiens]